MKVYISEEDFEYFEDVDLNKLRELKVKLMDDVDLGYYDKSERGYPIIGELKENTIVQSLEQHDAEIRKQAKQEVIDSLLEWVEENDFEITMSCSLKDCYVNGTTELKQKLNQMKEVE